MSRKRAAALIGAVTIAVVGAGILVATQYAAGATRSTAGQHIVMQRSVNLPSAGDGLVEEKLFNAASGFGKLTRRIAVSSITIGQFDGSQAIQVAIRAASCDNANAFGELEYVVVPQGDTIHLDYPSAVRMPLTTNLPTSYCLYAETVKDGGTLEVALVATTL